MNRIFAVYQIAASFVLLPFSYRLWLREPELRHDAALAIVLLPVIFGYVVPGIGTNITRLWEFKAGLRAGRYTLLHGLMFGGASSFLAWCYIGVTDTHPGELSLVNTIAATAVIIGMCNWLFDYLAIKYGIAVIRNKPYAEKKSSWTIVADYAPVYFGFFGGSYGAAINRLAACADGCSPVRLWMTALASCLSIIILPIVGHCLWSYLRHGYSGLFPYRQRDAEAPSHTRSWMH